MPLEFDWRTHYEPDNPVRVMVHRGTDDCHVRVMIDVAGHGGCAFTLSRDDARALACALEEHRWAAITCEWGEDALPELLPTEDEA